jgi:hypothetical protein
LPATPAAPAQRRVPPQDGGHAERFLVDDIACSVRLRRTRAGFG